VSCRRADTVSVSGAARRNLVDLRVIEGELFAWTVSDPAESLRVKAKYWHPAGDGTVPVFLRNPWIE
jgi:hypothetical protein